MIVKPANAPWQSTLLLGEQWLEHSFGTALTPLPAHALLLKQVHSTQIVDAESWREGLEGDGLVTSQPGVTVGVKTADCVPILIADPASKAVAAVHAGWRGTVDGIARRAVEFMISVHGSDPHRLLVAMGPSIGRCCFEVGPDVAPLFTELFPERQDLGGRTSIDLREANARQFKRAGVSELNIDFDNAPCTCCGGPEFHSWRRDRGIGQRMYSVLCRRAN